VHLYIYSRRGEDDEDVALARAKEGEEEEEEVDRSCQPTDRNQEQNPVVVYLLNCYGTRNRSSSVTGNTRQHQSSGQNSHCGTQWTQHPPRPLLYSNPFPRLDKKRKKMFVVISNRLSSSCFHHVPTSTFTQAAHTLHYTIPYCFIR